MKIKCINSLVNGSDFEDDDSKYYEFMFEEGKHYEVIYADNEYHVYPEYSKNEDEYICFEENIEYYFDMLTYQRKNKLKRLYDV